MIWQVGTGVRTITGVISGEYVKATMGIHSPIHSSQLSKSKDVEDKLGNTPLHCAVSAGRPNAVGLLLEA